MGVGTITTMSSWRVLTAIRLTRSASAPAYQALPARGRSSLAKAEKQQHKNNQSNENGSKAAVAIASATALALKIFYDEQGQGMCVQAENDADEWAHENRVRMYMAPDKIFNYFASFQLISGSGGQGGKTMMMTPMDFYSAITPDCQLAHGVGAGVHVDITAEQLAAHEFEMRSLMSFPTARSSPSAMSVSAVLRPSSSLPSLEWKPVASMRPPTTPS